MEEAMPIDQEISEEEKQMAIEIMVGGLGKAEIEIAGSYTAPFFWTIRSDDGPDLIKNGSAFIVNTGERIFGITAGHVVDECLRDTRSSSFIQCMLGNKSGDCIPFHLGDRLIDGSVDIDIATFMLRDDEIRACNTQILQGYYFPRWPPPLPEREKGVTYCGFPGVARKRLGPRDIEFGCVGMGGIATNSHEKSISVQIEREELFRVLGEGEMPTNFNFGGMSGGPLLAIVQTPTLRSWMPAGVIIEGPNTSDQPNESISGFELIRARPMHFIRPDGMLDLDRWNQCS